MTFYLEGEVLESETNRERLGRIREAVFISDVDVGHFDLKILDHLCGQLLRKRIALFVFHFSWRKETIT